MFNSLNEHQYKISHLDNIDDSVKLNYTTLNKKTLQLSERNERGNTQIISDIRFNQTSRKIIKKKEEAGLNKSILSGNNRTISVNKEEDSKNIEINTITLKNTKEFDIFVKDFNRSLKIISPTKKIKKLDNKSVKKTSISKKIIKSSSSTKMNTIHRNSSGNLLSSSMASTKISSLILR